MQLDPIIRSLLETDSYKFSMGQAIYHQFPDYTTEWTFKCRNKDVWFTPAMVTEIIEQIKAYCDLRFTDYELEYLSSIPWMKPSYIAFLRLWRPNFDNFRIKVTDKQPGMSITTYGTWLNTSMYEIPVLAIVNEVYFRFKYRNTNLMADFRTRLEHKFEDLATNKIVIGNFSEFGLRRRLSGDAQDAVILQLKSLKDTNSKSRFVGTSNVYLAKKHGLTPTGTQAHEWIMCVGQGNHKHNPAYSNWYAMEHWVKEYGVLNGIALTDTITTGCFLCDFQLTYATLFSGVRHDSGDPITWGKAMLKHYKNLGIDPKTKTLLFSDSLNFQKAHDIYQQFSKKCNVAFGIGTYLSNDTSVPPLNIVMKVTQCNDQPVAKISDTPGKGMCPDPDYVKYLQRAIDWRISH